MEADFLPPHLRKYIVQQNYDRYTPIDQAVWRYILRQLKAFLSIHAHDCYIDGLEKSGIDVERIPSIDEISKKIQQFGWRAYPVSGFIPPAAFMELQSLGVLPIASDMRTMDHLLYTPAPDIVHEAAGHAPILVHPEFSEYLRQYAQVAKKAIISKEDLDLYEAIRDLSDIKENPTSTPEDIKAAEVKLDQVSKSMSHVSEATELGRMNWWTAEYGLIGSLENPKIFGAGLLSSMGESRSCLKDHVKKIPLTVDCIKMTYDITEQQPQLFVAQDFKTLGAVLEDMARNMAYRIGGLKGLEKAIEAKTVNTAELNSGIQISGQITEAITDDKNEVAYLCLAGPSQLCYQDKELKGHDKKYHENGFGTPIGYFKLFPQKCPSMLSDVEWMTLGLIKGKDIRLDFASGVVVTGTFDDRLVQNRKTILITLKNAKAEYKGRVLFAPEWGTYDIAIGSKVTSVFGSAADRQAYGETDDFIAKRVPVPNYSDRELKLHKQYQNLREIRESKIAGHELEKKLNSLFSIHDIDFKEDWLLRLEGLELLNLELPDSTLKTKLEADLQAIGLKDDKTKHLIQDGLALVKK